MSKEVLELARLEGMEKKILSSCLSILAEVLGGPENLLELDFPLSDELRSLPSLEPLLKGPLLSLDECQIEVQRTLPSDVRKVYAAYYTVDRGIEVISSRASLHPGSNLVVADPFMGSGRLLAKTVERVGPERVSLAWGVEPLPLPALVAYTSLMKILGDPSKVKVVVGDAFSLVPNPLQSSEFPKADIVVTNPPFTRWKLLPKDYRTKLLRLMEGLGYSKYVTRREVGLQIVSMFLVDHVLKDRGFLGAVLPASTFYTIYGRGYKELLLERYDLQAVVENSDSSFSVDSGFKELVILAVKGGYYKGTSILRVSDPIEELGNVDLRKLPKFLQINWLSLFSPLREPITELFEKGLSKESLGYWSEVMGSNLIRGLEMYGPDFFFIPNRYWSLLEEEEDHVIIAWKGEKLSIGKEFLVRALRKPSLYAKRIEVRPDSYMLAIPPIPLEELPVDLRRYVRWGGLSGAAAPAIKAFGRRWYSHVYAQVKTKQPFGRVFIPDKVDLMFKNRGVFANYSREPVSASKNFYLLKGLSNEEAKIVAAWLNSTPFLAVLHLMGRRISDTWTRLLENDYLELPMISPNPGMRRVVEAFDSIKDRDLLPLWDQLDSDYRRELDMSLLESMGLNLSLLEKLYSVLRGLVRST